MLWITKIIAQPQKTLLKISKMKKKKNLMRKKNLNNEFLSINFTHSVYDCIETRGLYMYQAYRNKQKLK